MLNFIEIKNCDVHTDVTVEDGRDKFALNMSVVISYGKGLILVVFGYCQGFGRVMLKVHEIVRFRIRLGTVCKVNLLTFRHLLI